MGLVSVTGLDIHRGDHPVGSDPAGDAEHPVVSRFDVPAGDHSQQSDRVGARAFELFAVQGGQRASTVTDQRVDERLPGGGIIPVTGWFARSCVVVVTGQHGADLRGEQRLVAFQGSQQLAARAVQLGDGVPGRDRVVDRRGVGHPHPVPITPASVAAVFVSVNSRRGQSEARNRFRNPTRVVGWNDSAPASSPAAACQRRSHSRRSHASWSDRPSCAWRIITVARVRAGTVGRPNLDVLYRSAK